MEGDEIEMSTEELHAWIEEKVKTNKLMSSDVLMKCSLLESLLERRKKQAGHLRRLCSAVLTCEAVVKKQYSMMGWEYRDTDSDGDTIKGCGNSVTSSPTTNGLTSPLPKRHDRENLNGVEGKKNSISRKGEPVVVLTRLSANEIRSLCPWMSLHHSNVKISETSIGSDSDMQWEPEEDSSGSEYSVSNTKTVPNNKRRKMDQKTNKLAPSRATPQASANTGAKSNVTSTTTLQAGTNSNAKSNLTETSTPPATTKRVCPTSITTFRQTVDKTPKTSPRLPPVEFKTNMSILARKKTMSWVPGKILEKVTKDNGKMKYKIKFEEKGKSLVSGHHIAFDCMPMVDHLFVGARVVVKLSVDLCQFCPGVLGELPNRRNRMRFLVFVDDHKPVYVALPSLRMVCQPLNDPLDDIPDGFHKNFMKGYMKAWPYPPQGHFKIGQIINVKLKGVIESCVVRVLDCSLMEVVVTNDQHREWLYRGSPCLVQINNTKKPLELGKDKQQNSTFPSS
ncbi:histone-lysine N-methyltransferase SETDB1-B-like isoform X2 [Clinocottus analis]|uniref:histone-lysine N-methyltransferase SETDB1-B-like isoform X2 n=1 Tax=Clinocottus analis TaxID=304258 RepID=UPI0035C10D7E